MTNPLDTALKLINDIQLEWTFTNTIGLEVAKDKERRDVSTKETFTAGTGDNQVNEIWHDRRIVTPSTPTDDIDLVAAVFENSFGLEVSFTQIKVLCIKNLGVPQVDGTWAETEGEYIKIGAAATTPFIHWLNNDAAAEITIHAGGLIVLTAPLTGYDVLASESTIRVTHDGLGVNDIEYDIIVAGLT